MKPKESRGLTPKQQRFVQEYLVDLNATAAAKRAGYSALTAEWQGPQLLGKTHVAAEIQIQRARLSERISRTVDGVLADIGRVRDNAMQLVPVTGSSAEAMLDHKAALKALELEGKHLGAFSERVELTGKNGAPLAVTAITPDEYRRIAAEMASKV